MTPKETANYDQAAESMARDWAPAQGRIFKALIKEGFTREEALQLLMNFYNGGK